MARSEVGSHRDHDLSCGKTCLWKSWSRRDQHESSSDLALNVTSPSSPQVLDDRAGSVLLKPSRTIMDIRQRVVCRSTRDRNCAVFEAPSHLLSRLGLRFVLVACGVLHNFGYLMKLFTVLCFNFE